MEWNIDRRLAIGLGAVGIVVGLIGVGITILFPDAKGLGWTCLFAACIVLLLWLVFETKQTMGRTKLSMVASILIGAVLGGGLAFLFWKTGITIKDSNIEKEKSTPQISWNEPAPITFGTPLTTTQLNAKFSVDGIPDYLPDIGAVLPVGRHELAVTFTPKDTTKYAIGSAKGYVVVTPAPPPPPHPGSEEQSKLEVIETQQVPIVNTATGARGYAMNVFYADMGNIPITSMTRRMELIVKPTDLTPEEEEDAEKRTLSVGAPDSRTHENDIQPGQVPRYFFSVPGNDSDAAQIEPKVQDVIDGKTRLYVFMVFKYRDAALPPNKVRITQFCGWFSRTFDVSHTCGINRIYTDTIKPLRRQ